MLEPQQNQNTYSFEKLTWTAAGRKRLMLDVFQKISDIALYSFLFTYEPDGSYSVIIKNLTTRIVSEAKFTKYEEVTQYIAEKYKHLRDELLPALSDWTQSLNSTDIKDDSQTFVKNYQAEHSNYFMNVYCRKEPFYMKVEAGTVKNHAEYFVRDEEELKTVQETLVNNPDLSSLAQEVFSEPQADTADPTIDNENSSNSVAAPEIIVEPQTNAGAPSRSSSSTAIIMDLSSRTSRSSSVSPNTSSSSLYDLNSLKEFNQKLSTAISEVTLSKEPEKLLSTHWQQVYSKVGKLLDLCEQMRQQILSTKNLRNQSEQLYHLCDFIALELYKLSRKISGGFRNGSRLYNFILKSIAQIENSKLPNNNLDIIIDSKETIRMVEKNMSTFKLKKDCFTFLIGTFENEISTYRQETAKIDNENLAERISTQVYIKI